MTAEQASTVRIGTVVRFRNLEGSVLSIRGHGIAAPYLRTTIDHPIVASVASYSLFELVTV